MAIVFNKDLKDGVNGDKVINIPCVEGFVIDKVNKTITLTLLPEVFQKAEYDKPLTEIKEENGEVVGTKDERVPYLRRGQKLVKIVLGEDFFNLFMGKSYSELGSVLGLDSTEEY